MARELEKAGVEPDDVADALEHGGLQVVVEQASRDPLERDERGVMAPQEALEGWSRTPRFANCVSLRVSNPHLRLGPRTPLWLPDERVESIER